MKLPKVSPCPIPELAEFLRPYRRHFYRTEILRPWSGICPAYWPKLSAKTVLGLPKR
jgi:hypothetical protein